MREMNCASNLAQHFQGGCPAVGSSSGNPRDGLCSWFVLSAALNEHSVCEPLSDWIQRHARGGKSQLRDQRNPLN